MAGLPNARPSARTVELYYRTLICQAFPAYTLESAGRVNARDAFQAMALLDAARKALS